MRWPIVTVALASCIEFGLGPIESTVPVRTLVAVSDPFLQQALPKVDLLFVVDDTSSMQQEQDALGLAFVTLADDLDGEGVLWQIGVVTTDGLGPDAGVLVGNPWILTPDTPDRATALSAAVQVGTTGLGPEAGIAAAIEALALSAPGEVNQGFRRFDASLHVVFVSDADDQSESVGLADPVAAFDVVLAGEAAATGLPAIASSVAGDVPSGCSSAMGSAQPAFLYTQVAADSGGIEASICAPDFDSLLSSLGAVSIAYSDTFLLSGEPVAGSVRVTVDGDEQVDGWELVADPWRVEFDEAPAAGAVISVSYLVTNS